MSREPPPPLPGGWEVKDLPYFTGKSQTFDDGDKLVHGQQGEMTGPAILESHKGKGVKVLFPGNKGGIDCLLTEVRRLHADSASPTTRHRCRPTSQRTSLSHCIAPAPPPPAASASAAPVAARPEQGQWLRRAWRGGAGGGAASEGGGRASPVHGCGLGARR